MIRYEVRTPRVALGFAAMAMTALTIGTLVVLPARIETVGQDDTSRASASGASSTCTRANHG